MKIPRILVVPITVAVIAAFSTLVGFIAYWLGAYSPQAWGFFTLIGIFLVGIIYVWGRSAYWWFTGTGDYVGRGFPKLFKK